MKENIYKLFYMLVLVMVLMMVLPPRIAHAQWSIYDGSVSPEALAPRPFMRATNIFTSPDVFENHNSIITEAGIPTNTLLQVRNTIASTQFLWRMNFAAFGTAPAPTFPAIDVTNLTVVIRARGHADRTHALDFDMDYNGERSRLSITTTTRLARIRNGTGPANVRLPVAPTEWVIYRFAMTETETRVFVNENPVPVMVFTPASPTTNRHFRIGDGDSGANFGSDIDWIIWDITGSFAPGEGTPVPFAYLTPQWDIRLQDLLVGGSPVAGFNPAVVHYEVILPPGAVNPPVVVANARLATSTVAITQSTAIPGTATIAVTSQDGLTTRTYSVHFRKRSSNANLATLTVGGTPVAGFNPDVISYDIPLPVGTTAAPAIAATVAEWSSTMAITQATVVPGTGTVLVTAEDGTTKTYTLNFRHVSTNANLANLFVGGNAVAGFSPDVTTYNVILPRGTTVAPVVTAVLADVRASKVITQAPTVPGRATVAVTAEAGNQRAYEVNFSTDPTGIQSPTEQLVRLFPNPADNVLNIEWTGIANVNMEIFSSHGHVVARQTIDSQSTRIEIGHLPAGIYIIRFRTEQNQWHKTFIKQ